MKKLIAIVLFSTALISGACGGQDVSEESPAPAAAAVEELSSPISSELEVGGSQALETRGCGFTEPPRCGTRNCAAMCVTCDWDICRSGGGSCAACTVQKQQCLAEC